MNVSARLRRLPLWVRLLGAVVVIAVAAVSTIAGVTSGGQPTVRATPHEIHLLDGPHNDLPVRIDSTLYVPTGVDKAHPAPAVIVAHGFGETKQSVRSDAEKLARHGYVVLAYSARGFGDSTGRIALDSPDYEVKDVHGLVNWLSHQPEVRQDAPGDPRVGMTGGSYGGAMSLLAAAYDKRIDAIVPTITWNSLLQSFFPGGVFANAWAAVFFGGQAQPDRTCGRFLPAVCNLYLHAVRTGQLTAAGRALLAKSSPAGVLDQIHAPTLLIQGETDSLFGLDQAQANARGIAKNGTPVRLAYYAGGHSAGNTLTEESRLQSLTESWLDHWLRGGSDPGRSFTFSVAPTQRAVPTPAPQIWRATGDFGTASVAVHGPPQPVVNPAGGTPAAVSSVPAVPSGPLTDALVRDIPGQNATFASIPLKNAVTVVGSGTVKARIRSMSGSATLFAKLYDVSADNSRLLPGGLVAPMHVTGIPAAGKTITVNLPAIVHRFGDGHRLALVIASTDSAYANSTTPATYQISAAGPLQFPTRQATRIDSSGDAWPWAFTAIGLFVVLLVALLFVGRRRSRSTGEGDVPLVVSGLSKRYGPDLLAVDGVAFRVEREQILGLLGPNGAGKTTTLRMLMGLIRPSAGSLTVFGEEIRPGAAVLRRIGAFVEGPGPLPHLSGMENLRLYWRSTGRPFSESHLDHVLEIAGLGEAINRRVRSYSHGMRQRLAIAQAMLGLPDLLVLDEPTNGLDPPQIRALREVLRSYATDGRTVLISSHLLAEVEQTCTHVIVMDRGRHLASGTVAEIVGSTETLTVVVDDMSRGATVLSGLSGVDDVSVAGAELVVRLGSAAASDVVRALTDAGLAVSVVTPRRRLEDAFVSLIGER
jgi:ABC-2 type transport system ATP-binding protein